MKYKYLLPLLLMACIAGSAPGAPLPKNPMMVLTVNVGQMLEKSGYSELKLWELIPKEELKEVPKPIMEVIRDPAASGLDLENAMHFFATPVTDLKLPKKREGTEPVILGGATFAIKDARKVESLLEAVRKAAAEDEEHIKKEKVEGATIYFQEEEASFLIAMNANRFVAIGSNYAEILEGIRGKRKKNLPKPAEWLRQKAVEMVAGEEPKTSGPFRKHLAAKADLSVFVDYQSMGRLIKSGLAGGEELEALQGLLDSPLMKFATDTRISMQVNFGNGSIEGRSRYFMKENPLADIAGKGVSPKLLDVLPSKPTLFAGMSMNMAPMRKMLEEMYLPILKEFMEEDFSMDKVMPQAGMSINDMLDIPGGDFVLYLRDVMKAKGPLPLPQADFILGLSIKDRGKFDKLMDKVMQPKDPKPDQPKINMDQILGMFGMAMTRKDDSIFLSHARYAKELKEGKSSDPLEKPHRDKLASSYAHFFLDFGRLAGIAETWIPKEEMEEEAVQQALAFLKKMDRLTVTQKQDYSSSMRLTFKDKKQNSLRAFGGFIKEMASAGLPEFGRAEEKEEEKEEKPAPPREKPPRQALIPKAPPPHPESIPYRIPTSREIDLDSDDFQKFLATFRGKISNDEKMLVGRWKGVNDTEQANEWEILQRGDRSFTMVIKNKEQAWEEPPVLHGAWRVDSGKLLYVVLQVENSHLPLARLDIHAEKVTTLEKSRFITIGETDEKSFNSTQKRVKRFESPRMWIYNNPESLEDFTFHIPPEPRPERQ